MKGLDEGETYQFRVRAVNDEGEGEPSKPTDPIVAVNQPAKPHIDLGKVKDITVKHGEDFEIKVPYTGWPVPGATWENNGKEIIPDNERVFGEQTEEFAILKTKKATRDDSGQYTLQLKNPSGTDSVRLNVTVLCKCKEYLLLIQCVHSSHQSNKHNSHKQHFDNLPMFIRLSAILDFCFFLLKSIIG